MVHVERVLAEAEGARPGRDPVVPPSAANRLRGPSGVWMMGVAWPAEPGGVEEISLLPGTGPACLSGQPPRRGWTWRQRIVSPSLIGVVAVKLFFSHQPFPWVTRFSSRSARGRRRMGSGGRGVSICRTTFEASLPWAPGSQRVRLAHRPHGNDAVPPWSGGNWSSSGHAAVGA